MQVHARVRNLEAPGGRSTLQHRREIDGLRAIAVIPIILLHAGFNIVSGGFVGVDVFFVISGYLITGILLADMARGTFSLPQFYERRARRILPALFVVMACCLPFAWKWMLPSELKSFAQSLVAVSLFSSNILFAIQQGYFAPDAALKPLLHTWSLAVEEQYYLVFPLILLGLHRFGLRATGAVLAVLSAGSLGASEWGWRHVPTANFYLAPFRAWELLAGSLCAWRAATRESGMGRSGLAANAASLLGLAMIVFSIFAFDETTPFPSVYALVPVGGAALVLSFGTAGTLAARLLSLRLFTGIGLISYSAYLWHQPLFAFARLRNLAQPSPWLMLALAALSLLLAYWTWRFVEQPARRGARSYLPTRKAVIAAATLGSALFVALGIAGHRSGGAPSRIAPAGMAFASANEATRLAPNYGLSAKCEGTFTLSPECRTTANPDTVLWGDSFAMHLGPALQASALGHGFVQMTKSHCAPIAGIAEVGPVTPWRDCIAFNDAVLGWIVHNPQIAVVIMASPYEIIESDVYGRSGWATGREQDALVARSIGETADLLRGAGKRVVIVSPPPATGLDLGRCLIKADLFAEPRARCDFAWADRSPSSRHVHAFLQALAPRVPVLWLDPAICQGARCTAAVGDIFLYRDAGHLSAAGSAEVGRKLALMTAAYALAR